MTTIAYKDGILAADTQLTISDTKLLSDDKIRLLNKDTILAAAGDLGSVLIAEKFFAQENWENATRPTIEKGKDDDNTLDAILIYKGKPYMVDGLLIPEPIKHPHYAVGSGWKFAMAAMHSGMSAPDAVKFASELDVYTNNRVRYINVSEIFASKKVKKTTGRGRASEQTSMASEETPVREAAPKGT